MQGASLSVDLEGIESLYNYFFDLYMPYMLTYADSLLRLKTLHKKNSTRQQKKARTNEKC